MDISTELSGPTTDAYNAQGNTAADVARPTHTTPHTMNTTTTRVDDNMETSSKGKSYASAVNARDHTAPTWSGAGTDGGFAVSSMGPCSRQGASDLRQILTPTHLPTTWGPPGLHQPNGATTTSAADVDKAFEEYLEDKVLEHAELVQAVRST